MSSKTTSCHCLVDTFQIQCRCNLESLRDASVIQRIINLFWQYSSFLKTHKVGNIFNFVFPNICCSLLCLTFMMLVNGKLYLRGYQRITFQDSIFHWSASFLMAQSKHRWRCWHSCVCCRFLKTQLELLVAKIQKNGTFQLFSYGMPFWICQRNLNCSQWSSSWTQN